MMIRIFRHIADTVLNEFFLTYLIQGILVCSAAMSVLALLVLAVSRKLRQSAAGRSLLWGVLGIGYLLPFKPHPAGALLEIGRHGENATAVSDMIADRLHSRIYPSIDMYLLLFFIWLFGAVTYAAVTLNRHQQYMRSIARLRMPADPHTQMLADTLCEQLGISEPVPVYTVCAIDTPMLTGLLHPCILLPEHAVQDDALRLILKHELCHFRRGDLFCKLIWIGCRAIHWFNPLMPLLMRQMEQDCELACDEAVMEHETAEDAQIYCKSILHTAMRRARQAHSGQLLATTFSGSREMLKARMHAILSRRRKQRFLWLALALLAMTAMTGSILAYAAEDVMRSAPPEPASTEISAVYTTAVAPDAFPETYTMPQTAPPPAPLRTEAPFVQDPPAF